MIWGDKLLENLIDIAMISEADKGNVNPASVNLRLGYTFLKPVIGQVVQLGGEMQYTRYVVRKNGSITMNPGEFMLATTLEGIDVPITAAAFVHGRSSIGRVGLTVQNAGFVDAGFKGHITLELKNDSPCPIVLYPGYPVAQLVFMDAKGVTHGYNGKYNGQIEATGSRMFLDNFHKPQDKADDQ